MAKRLQKNKLSLIALISALKKKPLSLEDISEKFSTPPQLLRGLLRKWELENRIELYNNTYRIKKLS